MYFSCSTIDSLTLRQVFISRWHAAVPLHRARLFGRLQGAQPARSEARCATPRSDCQIESIAEFSHRSSQARNSRTDSKGKRSLPIPMRRAIMQGPFFALFFLAQLEYEAVRRTAEAFGKDQAGPIVFGVTEHIARGFNDEAGLLDRFDGLCFVHAV